MCQNVGLIVIKIMSYGNKFKRQWLAHMFESNAGQSLLIIVTCQRQGDCKKGSRFAKQTGFSCLDTRYPIPNTQYPIPDTQYPIPDTYSPTLNL
jgi:hypothetical protein